MTAKTMKQLIEQAELKRFVDPRIIEALRNPVREHALAVLNERIASATQIGEEIGADVSLFYHHIEVLERLGCIERVDTRCVRGAKEHFFRAKSTFFFDSERWGGTPWSIKADATSSQLQSLFDEVATSANAGTLNTGNEEHVSWTPGRFDSQAWDEAARLIDDTLDRLGSIMARSAERLAERDEPGTPATVGLLGFKTGRSDPDQPDRAA